MHPVVRRKFKKSQKGEIKENLHHNDFTEKTNKKDIKKITNFELPTDRIRLFIHSAPYIIHFMTIRIWGLLAGLVLILSGCRTGRRVISNSQPDTELHNPDIQIIRATYSHWRAGIESGGKGLDLRVQIIIQNANITQFDSIVTGTLSIPVSIGRKQITSGTEPVVIHKGDTVMLHGNIRENKDNQQAIRSFTGSPAAKLFYSSGSKIKQTPIDSLVEIKLPNRP